MRMRFVRGKVRTSDYNAGGRNRNKKVSRNLSHQGHKTTISCQIRKSTSRNERFNPKFRTFRTHLAPVGDSVALNLRYRSIPSTEATVHENGLSSPQQNPARVAGKSSRRACRHIENWWDLRSPHLPTLPRNRQIRVYIQPRDLMLFFRSETRQ